MTINPEVCCTNLQGKEYCIPFKNGLFDTGKKI